MSTQVKINTQPVCLRFWDHVQVGGAEAEPMLCEVFGLMGEEDELCYRVISWLSEQTLDENAEQYVILKSAVVEVVWLEATKLKKRRTRSRRSAREKQRKQRLR